MITEKELARLLGDLESETVERCRAFDKVDKMGQAICAFANDLSDSKRHGYLLLGVENDGRISGRRIDDERLTALGGFKSEGSLLPPPAMSLQVFHFQAGDVAVIEVFPSVYPPIRYKGQVWVRVGARKALASEEDLHLLEEKRLTAGVRFEEMPCPSARLDDLDLDLFRNQYLVRAIQMEVIEDDEREVVDQLAALRFYDRRTQTPTNLGMILFGRHPELHIPSAYIQYVKYNATDNGGEIVAEHAYKGPLLRSIAALDGFVRVGVVAPHPVRVSPLREETMCEYPEWSLRELLLNAMIHRDYQIGNAPVKFYHYQNRLEISNSGGLFGQVNPENFPYVNDYRNPLLAEALKVMGYVNKFNRGIAKVKKEMAANGNPPPVFDVNKQTEFRVTLLPSKELKALRGEIEPGSGEIRGTVGEIEAESGEIKGGSGEIKSERGEIEPESGEIKVYQVIARTPGIKRERILCETGISLRTIDRIVKRLSNGANACIEYRGSKKFGGWYIKT